MVYLGSLQVLTACKDAAGVAGNIFAFGLFLSPVPTFRRIIRNESTEQFSGLPYIYTLLNCLITAWYGLPVVSNDNLLVTTVNSIGGVFQLVYITIFIIYADKNRKVIDSSLLALTVFVFFLSSLGNWSRFLNYSMICYWISLQFKMLGLLLGVLIVFAAIAIGSLLIDDFEVRHLIVGFLSCAALISMFASPLFIINLVIQTRSVEFMPFHLSLCTFLMSTSFLLYGIFNFDPFIYVPNGIGTLLAIIQLCLFWYYRKPSREDTTEPLIVSYSGSDV